MSVQTQNAHLPWKESAGVGRKRDTSAVRINMNVVNMPSNITQLLASSANSGRGPSIRSGRKK